MMGERLEKSAFRPLFIYNSYKNACQERKRSIACTFTCNGLLLQPG